MSALDEKHRDGAADLLKGAAVVLMIQVHIVELFAQPAILASWIGRLSLLLGGPPVAPVFMAVMGYFAGRSNKAAHSLVVRGLLLLPLGFALNLGLNGHLLLKIQGGELQLSPWEYVFGVDILLMAGLSLILIGLLRPLLGESLWSWILAAIVVVLVTPIANEVLTVPDARRWFCANVAGDYWWSYFPLFPWLAYPFLGVAFRLGKEQMLHDGSPGQVSGGRKMTCSAVASSSGRGQGEGQENREVIVQPPLGGKSRANRLLSGEILPLALAVTVPRVVATCHDLPKYYHHDGWLFLWICVFLCVWVRLFQVADRRCGRFWLLQWLKWMGRHITVLYVLQWLMIGNVATAVYKTQSVASCIVWGAVVLGAANLLAWIWTAVFTRRQGLPV